MRKNMVEVMEFLKANRRNFSGLLAILPGETHKIAGLVTPNTFRSKYSEGNIQRIGLVRENIGENDDRIS